MDPSKRDRGQYETDCPGTSCGDFLTVRAVLFDVGGPINTELEHERSANAAIIAAPAETGVAVTAA